MILREAIERVRFDRLTRPKTKTKTSSPRPVGRLELPTGRNTIQLIISQVAFRATNKMILIASRHLAFVPELELRIRTDCGTSPQSSVIAARYDILFSRP